jgi:hypothetical protein
MTWSEFVFGILNPDFNELLRHIWIHIWIGIPMTLSCPVLGIIIIIIIGGVGLTVPRYCGHSWPIVQTPNDR